MAVDLLVVLMVTPCAFDYGRAGYGCGLSGTPTAYTRRVHACIKKRTTAHTHRDERGDRRSSRHGRTREGRRPVCWADSMPNPPSTAFVVTGQCRAGPSLLFGVNLTTSAATRRFLASHAQHVVRPHMVDNQSAIFLVLKQSSGSSCDGTNLCHEIYRELRVPCHFTLIADSECRLACPECRLLKSGQPSVMHPSCFSQNMLSSWTPIWCSMWLALRVVQQHESHRGFNFSRLVYSRVDMLFESSMGPWSAYRQEWHSGHLYCHDFFWILSRRMAACALAVYSTQLRCAPNTQCCNPKWRVSWWPWSYCTSPFINPGVPNLHAVEGNFSLETRRDGLRHCFGAPHFTFARDAARHSGPQQRLADSRGQVFRSNPPRIRSG